MLGKRGYLNVFLRYRDGKTSGVCIDETAPPFVKPFSCFRVQRTKLYGQGLVILFFSGGRGV